jgi:uncharacterized membrane protein
MKVRLIKLWDDLRSSYWFIPSLMTLGALAAAIGTGFLDSRYGSEWLEGVPWLYANKPEGARAVLSTIAGSMITVAGVVFSITMAAVVYASGQYGPRLLSNFMRDRGNQVTLGTFIATFIYCLQVLRTVRDRDETGGSFFEPIQFEGGFVPHIGMLGALGLTLASIGVLIFFIHHVPGSIHISNVIGEIGNELRESIEKRFPEHFGRGAGGDEARPALPDGFRQRSRRVDADGSGYIQAVDESSLLRQARAHDLVIHLRARPGDFVRPGKALVEVFPAERATEAVADEVRLAFAWGRRRSPAQDYMFLVDELVEIAARALSPGVNDPFTAIGCLDWLGGGVAAFAEREVPEAFRLDDDGRLRVIVPPITFEDFTEAAFGQLRPYIAADRNATLHLLKELGGLAASIEGEGRREVLREHATRLVGAASEAMSDPASLSQVRARYNDTLRLLRAVEEGDRAPLAPDW